MGSAQAIRRNSASRQNDASGFSWLGGAVLRLDDRLRQSNGVFEYTKSADCLFRLKICQAPQSFHLSDGVTVARGDPIADLHVWNEHVALIRQTRGVLSWGSRVTHGVVRSLEELVVFLDGAGDLAGVNAVCANMGLGVSERTAQLLRMCRMVGFERVPVWRPVSAGEHLHRAGENVLGLLLTMAVNPASARPSILARDRALVAISRAELRRRYGRAASGAGGQQLPRVR